CPASEIRFMSSAIQVDASRGGGGAGTGCTCDDANEARRHLDVEIINEIPTRDTRPHPISSGPHLYLDNSTV
ncbi:hypothetical protein, partial [Gordonia aquimaris]